jgi:hypothetical protein
MKGYSISSFGCLAQLHKPGVSGDFQESLISLIQVPVVSTPATGTLSNSALTGMQNPMLSVQKKCDPVMTAYKLVTVDVPYFGWGSSVEKFIAKVGPSATNLTHSFARGES